MGLRGAISYCRQQLGIRIPISKEHIVVLLLYHPETLGIVPHLEVGLDLYWVVWLYLSC